jgi:hypothetical protein
VEGNWRGLIYDDIYPVKLRKATNYLSQDSWSQGRDLNPETPEYEAGMLDEELTKIFGPL